MTRLVVAPFLAALAAGCPGARSPQPRTDAASHGTLGFPDGVTCSTDASGLEAGVPETGLTTDQGTSASLPGSGSMQALGGFVMPSGQLLETFWRNDQGWYRIVPLLTDGTPDWSNASAWDGPEDVAALPGSGSMQAVSGFMMPSGQLFESFWRGDQRWYCIVPILPGGTPDWSSATAWSGPTDLSSFPGSGSMQGSRHLVLPNGQLFQSLWRGDQGWDRTIPFLPDGTPDWSNAGAWVGPRVP